MKYSQPVWKMVLDAAKEIEKDVFTAGEIVEKIHEKYPEVPAVSIRTYVIAMAPNHPSSKLYPATHKLHRYFEYLGDGKFKLRQEKGDEIPSAKRPLVSNDKEEFLRKYEESIVSWVTENKDALILGRKNYSWNGKSLIETLSERNQISRNVVLSRIKNQGGVDIETINQIMNWGGLRPIKLENKKALEITAQAFTLLDKGDLKGATSKLLSISGVGIASATKIIGLFDQNQLAIYDSRVGTALRTLKHEDERLVKCPVGRTRIGDTCTDEQWVKDYEKLIWILEVVRNWLNEQGYPFSIADVEMALFIMGK